MYTTCSEVVVSMYWNFNSMNNLLTYCGLVATRISASDKDLPVQFIFDLFQIIALLIAKEFHYIYETVVKLIDFIKLKEFPYFLSVMSLHSHF